LIAAAFSEVNPGTAGAEAEAVAWAVINRARDAEPGRYGYTNTGNLDSDIVGQVHAPRQVQGVGNAQWRKVQTLLSGGTVAFDTKGSAEFAEVVAGVEKAYAGATSGGSDPTNGATFWDHPPSTAGQGASQKSCAPEATGTIGTAGFAKCSK
jgi:hypothetical protein